jgi:hypothetical protein
LYSDGNTLNFPRFHPILVNANPGLGLVTEYSDLAPRERAAKYRELAAEASKEAERAKDRQLKEAYIVVAESWEEMARDVERGLARRTELGGRMTIPWLAHAAQFRSRAEKVRTASERFSCGNRDIMLRIATEYDGMAATMEQVDGMVKLAGLLSR